MAGRPAATMKTKVAETKETKEPQSEVSDESSTSVPRCSDSDSSDSESEAEPPTSSFHRRVSTNRTLKNSVIVKEGWLLKQTTSFQRWRRRYFKLQGKKLYYAKDFNSPIFDEVSLSDISLAERGVKNANRSKRQ
ncbi:putative Diacylglycerol kinase eta [Hypsibius exemplaris]|uniref:Diacylglycerol kinase eta n=1 Tax=Hypsibius exemplaris TaxID=2072580 RepID=A0A1W0WYX8_HYPEX|nr:putative Diacylglycerol kinase eta [Hypsibius exemplaris]